MKTDTYRNSLRGQTSGNQRGQIWIALPCPSVIQQRMTLKNERGSCAILCAVTTDIFSCSEMSSVVTLLSSKRRAIIIRCACHCGTAWLVFILNTILIFFKQFSLWKGYRNCNVSLMKKSEKIYYCIMARQEAYSYCLRNEDQRDCNGSWDSHLIMKSPNDTHQISKR